MLELLQLFFSLLFFLAMCGLFVAVVFFTCQVCIRLWNNKVTPWINEHFGESGW